MLCKIKGLVLSAEVHLFPLSLHSCCIKFRQTAKGLVLSAEVHLFPLSLHSCCVKFRQTAKGLVLSPEVHLFPFPLQHRGLQAPPRLERADQPGLWPQEEAHRRNAVGQTGQGPHEQEQADSPVYFCGPQGQGPPEHGHRLQDQGHRPYAGSWWDLFPPFWYIYILIGWFVD